MFEQTEMALFGECYRVLQIGIGCFYILNDEVFKCAIRDNLQNCFLSEFML